MAFAKFLCDKIVFVKNVVCLSKRKRKKGIKNKREIFDGTFFHTN